MRQGWFLPAEHRRVGRGVVELALLATGAGVSVMPNKMECFTERARRVLMLAQEEAELLQHSYIGTEHLLLGLMCEEGGVAWEPNRFVSRNWFSA